MKIIFFTHPSFLSHQSMPRFARMLAEGMKERGHEVQIWTAKSLFSSLNFSFGKKWLGYVDQYIVFPIWLKRRLREEKGKVLYVFTDHALGPWVPFLADFPHVIHCHDFLAQDSAKGRIDENPVSVTGRLYQKYIRKGFKKGKNFISVSNKTRLDLERYVDDFTTSEIVYNGLNPLFRPGNPDKAQRRLSVKLGLSLKDGFFLHVGGNQWYKNRKGVIFLYDSWRSQHQNINMPLLLLGEQPSPELKALWENSHFKKDIHFFSDLNDEVVREAYAGASVFLFPSLAEGFGWPIAEAMASGTLTLTTNEDPMREVCGDAGFLVRKMPSPESPDHRIWLAEGVELLNEIINLNHSEKLEHIEKGLKNIQRFNLANALNRIETIYKSILNVENEF